MRVRLFLTLVFVAQLSLNLLAQQDAKSANFYFKADNYVMAAKLYKKLVDKDSTNELFNYRLGISYLNCNTNPPASLKYLKRADADVKQEPEFLYALGKAYLYNNDYKNAKDCFTQCSNKAYKDEEMKKSAELWYNKVQTAERMVKSPLNVEFINMGKGINTVMDEITPFVTVDDQILLYTTNIKFDRDLNIYTNNVYISNKSAGVFKKGKSLTAVNSVDDEFMAGISMTDNRIFVQLQGYEGFQDLMSSERNGKSYRGKNILGYNVNSEDPEFAACETYSGDTLFFSSGREGGYGGMDIYFCLKLPTGEWGIPQNVGDKINTIYDEDFPMLSRDGKKLYFASNNPKSMGGYDVFVSTINSRKEFSTPKNIGYPLNDVYDNKTIAFSKDDRYAYVSAFRPGGYGGKDLYRVVFKDKDPSVKILIIKFKKENGSEKVDFAGSNKSLKIAVHKKGKEVFGKYSYDSKNSTSTIALTPGVYNIDITGIGIEKYTYKITIPDTPTGKKIEKKEIVLKLK
jgi:tetratricopeptide (TPR) repeat protein